MSYDKSNIFNKIIIGAISANKVYEDELLLAFHDTNPVAETHILIIPKGEYKDYAHFITDASGENIKHYFSKIAEIAQKLQIDSYRLITNKGAKANQTIMHFHTHLLAGNNLSNF